MTNWLTIDKQRMNAKPIAYPVLGHFCLSTGTVGIEPTHIIRPSTIQLSRRYLYRFPITVHVPTVSILEITTIETAGFEPAYPVVVSTRCTAIRLQNNKFDRS